MFRIGLCRISRRTINLSTACKNKSSEFDSLVDDLLDGKTNIRDVQTHLDVPVEYSFAGYSSLIIF